MDVKVKQIREKLKTDILIHEKTLKKYKKAHKICYFIQLVLNMATVAGASSSVGLLTVSSPIFPAVGTIIAVTSVIGLTATALDKSLLDKVCKHSQIVTLAKALDLEMIKNGNNLDHLVEQMKDYYDQKDGISRKYRMLFSKMKRNV